MQLAAHKEPSISAVSVSALLIGRDCALDAFATRRGDLSALDILIVATVVQANLAAIATPDAQLEYATLDGVAPETLRRPVSISRLAQSLDMPFETIRRHLRRLEAAGVLNITPQGVMAPERRFDSPEGRAAAIAIDALCRRTFERLQAVGFFASRPLPAASHHPAAPPIRLVTRLMADYVLRFAQDTRAVAGGHMDALLLLEISRRNVRDLGDDRSWAEPTLPFVPDDEKRPASVSELAQGLGLSFETARRHLVHLAEADICQRVDGGYIITAERLAALCASLVASNDTNLWRLYRGCAQLGVIEAWAREG